MVTTLTLNPAVDKTFYIDDFRTNELNRATRIQFHAGSKGINVARFLKKAGIEATACGFAGGYGGKLLEDILTQEGVAYRFVKTKASTRVNTKVADLKNQTFTDINEPGGEISGNELEALFLVIDKLAKTSRYVALGGSIQPGMDIHIYQTLIARIHKQGALCALDCGGQTLQHGVAAKPEIIKPNLLELSQYMGSPLKTEKEIATAAASILQKGVKYVLVSLGEHGSFCFSQEGALRVQPIAVEVNSTIGAGDAFLTGFLYGTVNGFSFSDCVRHAASFSTAKVCVEGCAAPAKQELMKYLDEIKIERR